MKRTVYFHKINSQFKIFVEASFLFGLFLSDCSQFCLVYVLKWKVERDFKWGTLKLYSGSRFQWIVSAEFTFINEPSLKLN